MHLSRRQRAERTRLSRSERRSQPTDELRSRLATAHGLPH